VDLCQFFTDAECSNTLVSEMGSVSPTYVLDMAAGQGSLTLAAMRRWQSAKVSVFDVDRQALSVLQRHCPGASRVRVDLLHQQLPQQVATWFQQADVVLCNPPFKGVPLELADHWLQAAGMPKDWSAHIRQRSEIVFLAHNLRLLKPGGELVMILPAVFVNGHHFLAFRAWLLRELTLIKVIRLPVRAFSAADVRTYALIVRKRPPMPEHQVEAIDLDGQGGILQRRLVKASEGLSRLDFPLEATRSAGAASWVLSDLGAEISRGWAVQRLDQTRKHFFHTTGFGVTEGAAELRLPTRRITQGAPYALAGDILQARVGRRCHLQTVALVEGRTMFSDCVYRIRVSAQYRRQVLGSLLDARGRAWRCARVRGSTVPLLSKSDLLNHPVWSTESSE